MRIVSGNVSIAQWEKPELKIFAIDKDGDEFEITDLYWFEENYIHDLADPSNSYTFRVDLYIPPRLE